MEAQEISSNPGELNNGLSRFIREFYTLSQLNTSGSEASVVIGTLETPDLNAGQINQQQIPDANRNPGSPPQILEAQVLSPNPGELNDSISRLIREFLTSKECKINITLKALLSGSLAYMYPVGLGSLISGGLIGGGLLLGTLIASRCVEYQANSRVRPLGPKMIVAVNTGNILIVPWTSFVIQDICKTQPDEAITPAWVGLTIGSHLLLTLISESMVIDEGLLRQNGKIQRAVAEQVAEPQNENP